MHQQRQLCLTVAYNVNMRACLTMKSSNYCTAPEQRLSTGGILIGIFTSRVLTQRQQPTYSVCSSALWRGNIGNPYCTSVLFIVHPPLHANASVQSASSMIHAPWNIDTNSGIAYRIVHQLAGKHMPAQPNPTHEAANIGYTPASPLMSPSQQLDKPNTPRSTRLRSIPQSCL